MSWTCRARSSPSRLSRSSSLRPTPPVSVPPAAVAAVCLFLCGVFAFLDLYVTQPLLPLFTRLFHASKSVASLTVSTATLGVAISAPILGALAERLSRKRVIVTSIIALSIPTLLAATSPSLRALDAWRFLQGLILPGIFAIAITYIGEEWDHHAVPIVMSIYVSGTALGGFLGRITAGLVAEHFNWRWSFVTLTAYTLLGAALVGRWLPAETRPMPSGPRPALFA